MNTPVRVYEQAMDITDQAEADEFFTDLVEQRLQTSQCDRQEAERIERSNLGYFAGYCNDETRERVERLFRCEHPIFGKFAENGPPTTDEAMELGMRRAQGKYHTLKQMREEKNGG